MSTYFRITKHPITGEFKNALWADDYFGHRQYGVIFNVEIQDGQIVDPMGNKEVFKADDYKWEFE